MHLIVDKQVQEKIILRDEELIKNRAYSNKLLEDCATSLKLDKQNKKATPYYLDI